MTAVVALCTMTVLDAILYVVTGRPLFFVLGFVALVGAVLVLAIVSSLDAPPWDEGGRHG